MLTCDSQQPAIKIESEGKPHYELMLTFSFSCILWMCYLAEDISIVTRLKMDGLERRSGYQSSVP